MAKTMTAYEAYCIKYEYFKAKIKRKNIIMTPLYSEEEFLAILERAEKTLVDSTRDNIIQYIVLRQKKYKNLF